MLVSLKDLLKARFNTELRNTLESAALVLPISESICKGAEMLKRNHIPELFSLLILYSSCLELLKKRARLYILQAEEEAFSR